MRPRDAASLIILRRGSTTHSVLMGRRRADARFMPGVYVFPGGAVEGSDAQARAVSALNAALVAKMGVSGRSDRAQALAMAAIRETFEETGLLIGQRGDVGPVAGASWRRMREGGLAPSLAPLDFVGRAVTPTFQPIRFNARFFFAGAEHVQGSLVQGGELEDLRWIALGSVADYRMADVTRYMLAHLQRIVADAPARHPGHLLFTYRRRRRCLRYL